MKALRPWLLVLASITGLAGVGTAAAAPVRNTFYDCGLDISCTAAPPSVLLQFTTDDILRAPAVPPAGTYTDIDPVDVLQRLEGSFAAFGISTFNTNNAIGGLFVIGLGMALLLGAFADPGFPAPVFSVYEERMHAWVGLPPGVEHHRLTAEHAEPPGSVDLQPHGVVPHRVRPLRHEAQPGG